MRARVLILAGCVLAVLAAGGAALALWTERLVSAPLLRPDDPEVVARGRLVYTESCAACHGADLKGQEGWQVVGADGTRPAPPQDETGHTWLHSDKMLYLTVKTGEGAMICSGAESGMPEFGGALADADIVAVLSYIKSTWPPEIRAAQDRVNAAAD